MCISAISLRRYFDRLREKRIEKIEVKWQKKKVAAWGCGLLDSPLGSTWIRGDASPVASYLSSKVAHYTGKTSLKSKVKCPKSASLFDFGHLGF
jgi:hypothetical protein